MTLVSLLRALSWTSFAVENTMAWWRSGPSEYFLFRLFSTGVSVSPYFHRIFFLLNQHDPFSTNWVTHWKLVIHVLPSEFFRLSIILLNFLVQMMYSQIGYGMSLSVKINDPLLRHCINVYSGEHILIKFKFDQITIDENCMALTQSCPPTRIVRQMIQCCIIFAYNFI